MNRAEMEVEKLAEVSHAAWAKEKRKQGFHHPDECPNKMCAGKVHPQIYGKYCEKCHDGLCSYDDLLEEYKNLDRATLKAVIFFYDGTSFP